MVEPDLHPDEETSQRVPLHLPSRAENRRAARVRSTSPLTWVKEILLVVLLALTVSTLLRLFLIQVFWIPSSSMRETLNIDDRIAVSRIHSWTGDVRRGDIVVFRDDLDWLGSSQTSSWWQKIGEFTGLMPAGGRETLVKRVIGVSGDHVTCCDDDGRLSVNGTVVEEPYLASGELASNESFDVIVPEGHLWVMGDNRDNSADSRFHTGEGDSPYVAVNSVVGVASAIIWPVAHWSFIPGRDVFSGVSDAPQS